MAATFSKTRPELPYAQTEPFPKTTENRNITAHVETETAQDKCGQLQELTFFRR